MGWQRAIKQFLWLSLLACLLTLGIKGIRQYQFEQKVDRFILQEIVREHFENHDSQPQDYVLVEHHVNHSVKIGSFILWEPNGFLRVWKWENGELTKSSEAEIRQALNDCRIVYQFWTESARQAERDIVIQAVYPGCLTANGGGKAQGSIWTLNYGGEEWQLYNKFTGRPYIES